MAVEICPQCQGQVIQAVMPNGDERELVRAKGTSYVVHYQKEPITQRFYNVAREYQGVYVIHTCTGPVDVQTFDAPAKEKIVAPKTLGDPA